MTVVIPPGVSSIGGTSGQYLTGSWRTERPVYVNLLPPCSAACPAGEEIQQWLYESQEDDEGYERAWRKLTLENPLPATMGRVCYHPCQDACNRTTLDETVGINAVERFLGDRAIEKGWQFKAPEIETGKKVLVVGAGPAGLAAAYHLRMHGHSVTIREANDEPGGMLRYGIPAYRLPREVLAAEIDRLAKIGIKIECTSPVEDIDLVRAQFDSVILCVGAGVGHHVNIPAGTAAKVMDAVEMLAETAAGTPPLLGRRVAIYGGGNTAMDAARTAKRLGAEDAVIIYRRTKEQMPAHEDEYMDAVSEGIRVKWLSTINKVEDGGKIVIERMELDEHGRPVPTGKYDEIEADTVVLAIGQDTDLTLVENNKNIAADDGVIVLDNKMMTGEPGVFAAGDAAPGDRTATYAIGQGKLAARHINSYLMGVDFVAPPRLSQVPFDRLNTWYYSDAPEQKRDMLAAARRTAGFDEVVQGLDENSALFEARRCMSCGNCFECDNCFGYCPDNAIIKLGAGKRYEFNYDYCKGCSICFEECPCGAIEMIPEQR